MKYSPFNHRSTTQGYNNPEVLREFGRKSACIVAALLETEFKDAAGIFLLAPPTSGLCMATVCRLYLKASARVFVTCPDAVAKHVRCETDGSSLKWGCVFIDDYLYEGNSLQSGVQAWRNAMLLPQAAGMLLPLKTAIYMAVDDCTVRCFTDYSDKPHNSRQNGAGINTIYSVQDDATYMRPAAVGCSNAPVADDIKP